MELAPEVISAIRRITDRFIRLGKSTPVHEIKSTLGEKRRVLDGLIQERVIQRFGENYLPCLRAVTEFEPPDLQRLCFDWVELVLRALKLVYMHAGDKDCSRDEVDETITKTRDFPPEPEALRVGMLFAAEFSGYFGSSVSDATGGVASIRVTEGILDFETVVAAWQSELDKRRMAAEQAIHTSTEASLANEVGDRDSLLGLYNRGRFDRDFREVLPGARLEVPHSVIMIDLDGFKQVNDDRGHTRGDEALKVAASQINASCSGKGPCYRWGGDEFVILLKNYALGEATALGERIRSRIEEAGSVWRVTASVGVACFPVIVLLHLSWPTSQTTSVRR